jgi:hypothetical protein
MAWTAICGSGAYRVVSGAYLIVLHPIIVFFNTARSSLTRLFSPTASMTYTQQTSAEQVSGADSPVGLGSL